MKKKFNITGTCIPDKHYMVNIDGKLRQILAMVEEGAYFTIHRPRQYGKTTTLFLLMQRLFATNDYLPIKISFEGIGTESYASQELFFEAFVNLLSKFFQFNHLSELDAFLAQQPRLKTFQDLDRLVSALCAQTSQKLVLMIDEVDKSSNNQLFLDFLGLLRAKYLLRNEGQDVTFHAVILAGVHDVKSLKLKIRPEQERKYNSPWNIAADFLVDMSFQPDEIATMLTEYAEAEQVALDIPALAERLYYYTSGYPFLVSKLCKLLAEQIAPRPQWQPTDVEGAVNHLLTESNTNFESLIKNLENNADLYQIVYELIILGEQKGYNVNNPTIHWGALHGVFANEQGRLKIHNRIYELLIYDYMSSKLETSLATADYNFRDNFIDAAGNLDFEQVLLKFQEFMRQEYSRKDADFLERHGRLIFLAFLKPIINGQGFDFKEVQISEERRLDVVVTWRNQRYVVELKVWRGDVAHQKGMRQLCEYLARLHLNTGYLIAFDGRKREEKTWRQEWIAAGATRIFLVTV
jgi:hypothetical protein